MRKIIVGAWRDDSTGPMQVVSGPMGRERVHYEAPSANRLEAGMTSFLEWFNEETHLDAVLKAGLAHLWFVTIHPFDDGNGRIARAITDMELARSEKSRQRLDRPSSPRKHDKAAVICDPVDTRPTRNVDCV
ncbi:MAG TPA: Fic family protein [Gemmatimonadales bacterium]|jgi:Fic family protein